MTTTKKRINIVADKDIENSIKLSAKREGIPVATKASQLLRLALEIEEDLALAQVAQDRLKEKNLKYVTHKNAWK